MHEHRHTELTDGRVVTAADTSAFHFTCTVHPCTISVTGKSPFEMYASEVQKFRHTPSYITFTAFTIAHTLTISRISLKPGRPINNGATSNKLHDTCTVSARNYHRRL